MNRRHVRLILTFLMMWAFIVTAVTAHNYTPQQVENVIYLPLITRPELPEIVQFAVEPAAADPGQTVTLSWEVLNADEITLTRYWDFRPAEWWENLPLTGTHDYTVPDWERNPVYFTLDAYDSTTGVRVNAGVVITVICPDIWFFEPAPNGCPTAPLYSLAAEQPFEGGYMLWLDVEDRIIVLFADDNYPQVAWYEDEWAGEPICNLGPPPADRLHPTRGFGKIWCDFPAVRDRLGWATDEEIGYETILQRTTLVKYNHTYFRAADGNVWHLLPEFSGWEKITVEFAE